MKFFMIIQSKERLLAAQTKTQKAFALILALFAVMSPTALAQEVDTTAAYEARLREIEAALSGASTPQSATQQRSRLSTNPDISVIGDGQAWYTSEGDRNFDMALNEVETSFRSVVDPYARADVYLSIAQEDGAFEFELEEAYLTTLSLPYHLQLRAGKFRNTLGKINRIHPHALPYIDTPLVYAHFFGDEGLNDQGVSLSWLVPHTAFFQELTMEVTRGPGEAPSFEAQENDRFLYTSHLKNFWDLSANTTLELGLSGLLGPNAEGESTMIGGVDLTYKWKPVQYNTYRSFTLQTEAFWSNRKVDDDEEIQAWGVYALAGYQLSRRWVLYGRFDHSDLPDDDAWDENAVSATVGWYLTEFQKLELGAKRTWRADRDPVYEGLFRMVFVIGTHGAHEY